MPRVNVVNTTPIVNSFRVQQIAGLFDLRIGSESREAFTVDVPSADEEWSIGAIVGPSGSGKSTVARAAYGDVLYAGDEWPADRAVVDAFPSELSAKTITDTLTAVGFASPPAWLRPYAALSNGERFRCDLARCLLRPAPIAVFDEFTSVVDRQVAKIASMCVARMVRSAGKKFVAVTCHYDVLEWLEPDWVVDMATGETSWRRLQRPPISFEISRCDRSLWRVFGRHHYLDADLHPAAMCYAACHDGRPVAFCATMTSFGWKGRRRIHRLVVLPDYQGVGLGLRLLNAVAAREAESHRISIVTSHPRLIRGLAKSPLWRMQWQRLTGRAPHSCGYRGSCGRSTASFEFTPAERRTQSSISVLSQSREPATQTALPGTARPTLASRPRSPEHGRMGGADQHSERQSLLLAAGATMGVAPCGSLSRR